MIAGQWSVILTGERVSAPGLDVEPVHHAAFEIDDGDLPWPFDEC